MAADTGMKLVILAGSLTFVNENLQTHFDISKVNWRVPVATVLGAVVVAGVGKISPVAATSLGAMAVIVAASTPLNGKSPIQQIASVVGSPKTKNPLTPTTKVA